jgi:hypothetical protein
MKRLLLRLAAALSLLLSLAAAAGWVTSYARTPAWHLVATAHSADLTRVQGRAGTALFTTTAGWSNASHHGFWDAWWALNRTGRLTLLAQVVDYEGTLRRVHAAPPSLTVEPPGEARAPAVVFARLSGSGPHVGRFGFAFDSDAQLAHGNGAPVSARAWMVTLPYWFFLLLGVPMPLLWLQRRRRRNTHVS